MQIAGSTGLVLKGVLLNLQIDVIIITQIYIFSIEFKTNYPHNKLD